MSTRFFDGKTASGRPVLPVISSNALHIPQPDATGEPTIWPLGEIVRQEAGGAGAPVSLHRRGVDERLISDDAAFLAALAAASGRRWPRPRWRDMAGVAAGILLLAAVGLGLSVAPGRAAFLIPSGLENWLGARLEASAREGHPACSDPEALAALRGLEARIAAAARLGFPVRVKVVRDAEVNAVALPGRRIVVMSGLIEKVEDADELAGVLAHETAHLVHRDPMAEFLRNAGFSFAAETLGLGGGGRLGSRLVSLAYSRRVEARADRDGVAYLQKAGLSPNGLSRFFVLLQRDEAEQGSGIAFLLDHPPLAARIEATETGTTGGPALDPAAFARLQGICDYAP